MSFGGVQKVYYLSVLMVSKYCNSSQRYIVEFVEAITWKRKLKFLGNLSLRTISVQAPFQWLGIDFIGGISKKSSGVHSWILVATDYYTNWIEETPTNQSKRKVVVDFLMKTILIRFGVPTNIIYGNSM